MMRRAKELRKRCRDMSSTGWCHPSVEEAMLSPTSLLSQQCMWEAVPEATVSLNDTGAGDEAQLTKCLPDTREAQALNN